MIALAAMLTSAVYAASSASPSAQTHLPKLHLQSSDNQTSLIELFSSEGCSSCPPADAWLASLKSQPGLWRDFVPVEFHVDYWNRLGWNDRFSKSQFTQRQNIYANEWRSDSVYTPNVVLNGKAVSIRDVKLESKSSRKVGVLSVDQVDATTFEVKFTPSERDQKWVAYGALLGNGLVSHIESGENSGKTLTHEFVTLALAQAELGQGHGTFSTRLKLPPPADAKIQPASRGIAVWVARAGTQAPTQAVGGEIR